MRNWRRKAVAALALACMVFAVIGPADAWAANDELELELKLAEEGETLIVGDEIHVRLTANQPVNLFGIEFTLSYDSEQLELLSEPDAIYNSDVFEAWVKNVDVNAGEITYALTANDIDGVTATQLDLAGMTFAIRRGGEIVIALTHAKAVVASGPATPEIPVVSAGDLQFHANNLLDLLETEVWLDLQDRKTYQLNVETVPVDLQLYWYSCHPEVVEVDSEGRLLATAPGIATVLVTDNAEVAPANLCADTGIGVPFQRDAVTVQVGTIIRVEWDDAAWRRGSLADLPVLTLIGNEILTAFTNEEGEAVFPYHFSGETMFLVDNNAERNGELVIQTEAYRVVFDPDIPDTKSGVIRVLPMKAPGTVPDEPFGIEDALWFVDHWDQVGRDYDLNGVRDERNDRRALLQRIPPLVTLPYVLE